MRLVQGEEGASEEIVAEADIHAAAGRIDTFKANRKELEADLEAFRVQ
jgi:hypothetical protein